MNNFTYLSANDITGLTLEVTYSNYHYPNEAKARKVWKGRTNETVNQIFTKGYVMVYGADVWNNSKLPIYEQGKKPVCIPVQQILRIYDVS